jgi:UDP:flavonoid glycosyltransferase YjiC (YdhE family)
LLSLPPWKKVKLSAEHLSTLLSEVLSNPTYRANAGKIQKAIASINGLSLAADLIEDSLGVTKTSSLAG